MRALVLAGFLLCFLGEVQAVRAADTVAERILASIVRDYPRFPRMSPPKALAGCFNWRESTPDSPDVRFLAIAQPLRSRRGRTSVARVASNALERCQRAQSREQAPCECQLIDRNGQLVLEPPDDFVRRFE